MPTTTYTSFDSEIVEQNRAGTIRDFVPNPLGSTVALLNSSQTKTDTWTYWPYGDPETTSSATTLRYVGTLGYYTDAYLTCIRARYYKSSHGRWMTPRSPYMYSRNNPVTHSETMPLPPPAEFFGCTDRFNRFVFEYCNWCVRQKGNQMCASYCDEFAEWYYEQCRSQLKKPPHRGGKFRPYPELRGIVAPERPSFAAGPCEEIIPVEPDDSCQHCWDVYNAWMRDFCEPFNPISIPGALPPANSPREFLEGAGVYVGCRLAAGAWLKGCMLRCQLDNALREPLRVFRRWVGNKTGVGV